MGQTGSTDSGLEQAFHVFNEVCHRLEHSYRLLERRVAQLNDELAAARSERLRQLAEKERLAGRLKSLLDALPAGVVVIGGDDVVQDCNAAAGKLLQEPLLGRPWHDVAARSFMRPAGAGQEATLKDGRRVMLSQSPLGGEPGRIVLIQDVTEIRSLEEMANRHQRLTAMGEMAASLAHQVRTPLASALLYASHLGSRPATPAEQHAFAGKILSNLHYLEHLVSDMLAFARGGSFRADDVDVSRLLGEVSDAVEAQLLRHNCILEIIDEAGHATLRGNRAALAGALQNLVTNAVQACGEGRCAAEAGRGDPCRLRLQARTVREGGGAFAELQVVDNGPGIPDELLDRIFEPFFTTRADGTGLGLAIVQAIVNAHEGTVIFDSAPGRGTTVTLRLPLAAGTLRSLHTAGPSTPVLSQAAATGEARRAAG